jgi:drug/metabolite transporter (DMT)-like permease
MKDPITSITPYDQELAGIKRDLADLRANLLGRLSREIVTLQTQKNSLTEDIQRLQLQRNEIEVQLVTQQGLNQQEVQRQQWIEQLASAIAVHLRANLNTSDAKTTGEYSDTFDHLMLNLDSTLRSTFQALQRDIESYQQDIDQQMLRMYGQKQQGEMLLASLVEKLNEQLEQTTARKGFSDQGIAPILREPFGEQTRQTNGHNSLGNGLASNGNGQANGSFAYNTDPLAPKSTFTRSTDLKNDPKIDKSEFSKRLKGFIAVMLASVLLSLQNVFFRIIFGKNLLIFGAIPFGGMIASGTQNSLMLLWVRMLLATPFMWLIAHHLRPGNVTRDIKQLLEPNKRLLLARIISCSVLQFVSFVSIIISLSLVKPALATTLFFIFPTVTVLLAWFLYGDRPNWQRWLTILLIYVGIVLTINLFGKVTAQPDIGGTIAAITSGVTFACYVIVSGSCFRDVNPVSFTAVNFSLIFALSCLTIPLFASSLSLLTPSLFSICVLIALTTIGGYIFTNFGIQLMGAAQSSLISAIGPALTTLLAFLIVGDTLDISQLAGIFLVIVGVIWLNQQNMKKSPAK